ncbi:cysteine synthase A [uncultured Clostridium sp.]|uniref:cysteine synthase A n=1 Tax=uncultured Clostridium sp. TaxID=59620 RepID=UPI00260AA6AC|nr:cysteine synthase A [uncultured Clostridium sp.]
MLYNNAIELIGNTPLLKVNSISEKNGAEVFVKLERFNASGSVKDRAALGMIEKAEREGVLKVGQTIVEPTSGNTGIALALIGSLKGYDVVIVMPESMTKERREVIKAYGAKLVLTEASKGMKGAIEKAKELADENGYFLPQQFENLGNLNKHYETTAEEIIKDIPDVDIVIAGVGTGGTVSGIGKRLKELNKDIKIIAVEPADSPVLSGGKPGPHKIQGIGAGFIPAIYKSDVVDEIIKVTNEEAFDTARAYAKNEGILVGVSSGAAIFAGISVAKTLGEDKKIVVIAPDGGEKYFSVGLYE